MVRSKQEARSDFKKGISYQQFFLAKNSLKYLTAQMYHQREILEVGVNKLKSKVENSEEKTLTFGIEKAYLLYQAA